ncbi:MAG TPA: phospholipase D-like domain-containing protein [Verrucomicrobiota bacterium]|jgi:cardiolipin synthase|nr:PLDc N-terminal domain-containing protein [Verrucomicrobiota bacterium]OQC25509.1 MAG: Cardiolipin synthase [Verrucomicrobia bacterium ADurb.Bin063]HRR64012.1 phospholipase D-like domain-containing protein [Candidatus Paceibacterota bacterium]MBP8015560.1 PLDc N-terminal domain-containing protein [Verrucomicrobiota bacterium]MDI9371910.1 phospholipase D-like domain-containing protein [Verrucomicrobiota bacterium]
MIGDLWAASAGDLAHHAGKLALLGLDLLLAGVASGHAILYKRDSRSAIAWVGFIWLVPLGGAALYFILGINRIRRQAVLLRRGLERYRAHAALPACPPDELPHHLPGHTGHLNMLARVVNGVVARPLLPGNRIEPLLDGDEAYPAMLEAIRQARRTVAFYTYIFDRDAAGLAFARALGEATRRGVEVRVLIDAAGTRYSWPTILRALRREGVRFARFLPSLALWHLMAVNLRTHRKILVADGRLGFTGGMNIRAGHCLKGFGGGAGDGPARPPRHPVRDIHFRVRGPVVAQLQEVFVDDWLFTTGELLRGEDWFPHPEPAGPVLARGVPDGPDEDFEKLRWTLLGALAIARYAVRIVTPYFLPDPALISALNVAAKRGVRVDIILPAKNNLPFVGWASRAMWWQVLEHGCHIWLTPPPFDHTKLMLVDGCWVLLGSANWDPRSLRLNFEYNLECYDAELARRLEEIVAARIATARPVTLADVDARSLPIRLRDGLARLFTPYL